MDNSVFSNYLSSLYVTSLAQTYAFLPKMIGALLVLLIGSLIAKWIKKLLEKSLEFLHISKLIKNTPLEAFFQNAEIGPKIEHVIGTVGYWLFMLLVIQTAVSILGLQSLAVILDQVLSYIPRIFSAIVILFFGVLIAGVLESLVKGSIRSIDGHHARLLGKIASYLTLTIFLLVSVSELGIAQQFIIILFIGLVTTVTISLGLAIGLGSKEVVQKIADDWYKNLKKELKPKD
ncbi:MAG: hypothetical protein ABI425_01340 [Patescibacteria group bacterium]